MSVAAAVTVFGEPPTTDPPAPAARRRVSCGWCSSIHVADVRCSCIEDPCDRPWCPLTTDVDPTGSTP